VGQRTILLLPILLLAPLHLGCRAAPSEADVQALNKLQSEVDSAIIAGETDRYLALLTEDAVLMPPNGPPVSGREAIGSWNRAISRQFRIQEYRSVDDEVVVAGDWAFRRASIDWTVAPVAGGQPVRDSGKYIIIYRRQKDRSWRVARDMWSSNSPVR
jgi:ketosteroid isomerase-like protein